MTLNNGHSDTNPSPEEAREGARDTCRVCRRVIVLRQVGVDAFTNVPVLRWVAARRSKHAPVPIECPCALRDASKYHQSERWTYNGRRRYRDGATHDA